MHKKITEMAKEKKAPESISDLGEFGLIDHLTQNVKLKNPGSKYGIGDDAAVVDYKDMQMVITTDMLTEGIHFDLIYTPLKHLGYKAAVVNFSDVYAMNAIPKQITVSIAVSQKFNLQMLEELYAGIRMACEKYGVDLIGGDTTASLTGLTLSITALGEASEEELTYRNGAKLNDVICVTGDLGAAYLGLLLLEREKKVFATNPKMQPQFEGYDYLLERYLKPEARKDLIDFFREKNIKPNAMIDISDGLSSELLHICTQSACGCKVYEEKIPVDTASMNLAEVFDMVPGVAALSGGEDYELLFTLPVGEFEKIKDNQAFVAIGYITDSSEGSNLITNAGTQVELKAQGWNAFKKS